MDDKESIKLIDAYLDESLTIEETEELNDLLENSLDFRQQFRNRVKLHSDLSSHYDSQELEIIPFQKAKKASPKPLYALILLAASIVILVLINLSNFKNTDSSYIASISIKETENILQNGKAINENQLARGEYSIDQGMIELDLPHEVTVAIEGPASFQLVDDRKMILSKGKISAHVGESGKGFVVDTPNGRIIDLGTRFGVSVSASGKTEAHVFQGKINVLVDNQLTELTKNQALALKPGNNSKLNADQASFPLPGFPLELSLKNADFESDNLLVGWPQKTGAWGGDHCESIKSFKDVVAFSNSKMLRFVNSYAKGGTDKGQNVSQLWQVVDLRQYSDEVGRGGVRARLSAFINKVSDAESTSFGIMALAFKGDMSHVKSYWDRQNEPLSELLAKASSQLVADFDNKTWEKLEAQLHIPAGSDFLLIQLSVDGDSNRNLKGHFVDKVNLEVSTVARRSMPLADWGGDEGSWHDASNWQTGLHPDLERESIRIMGAGKAVISTPVISKQAVILATHNKSEGHLLIDDAGSLSISANGELIVGYNELGVATLEVKGTLRTRSRAFIGRNNKSSTVILNGGLWDGKDTTIRMAQYGERGEDTKSFLKILNGGRLNAKKLELVHDLSHLELVDGYITVNELKIGGYNGQAILTHNKGTIRIDKLKFGPQSGSFNFMSKDSILEIKGSLSIDDLLRSPGSEWLFRGQRLKATSLKVKSLEVNGVKYSSFRIK